MDLGAFHASTAKTPRQTEGRPERGLEGSRGGFQDAAVSESVHAEELHRFCRRAASAYRRLHFPVDSAGGWLFEQDARADSARRQLRGGLPVRDSRPRKETC